MRFKLTVLFAVAVIILAWFSFKQVAPPFKKGELVPVFSLPDIEGKNVSLEEFLGMPALIHFWATWCPQCAYEMPLLTEFQKRNPEIKVLAVSEDEDIKDVRDFFKNGADSLTVLQDINGFVADSYKSYKVPETFLIDKEGKFLHRFIGAVMWNEQETLIKLQTLLK